MEVYEMMEAADLNWKIGREHAFLTIDGKNVKTNRDFLFRYKEERNAEGEIIRVPLDAEAISMVGKNWHVLQNEDFISYVDSWAGRNRFKIHSMGSVRNGLAVYVIVDIDSGFSLFSGKDVVSSYFVFSLFHEYGRAVDISFDQIRKVSGARMSLRIRNDKTMFSIKLTHRFPFDIFTQLREPLAFIHSSVHNYKERAELLSRRKFDDFLVRKYINDVYPHLGHKRLRYSVIEPKKIPLSIPGRKIYKNLFTQPGAEIAPLTWWNALNAVYYTMDMDPCMGHRDETLSLSSLYGRNRKTKMKALELAMEYALGSR